MVLSRGTCLCRGPGVGKSPACSGNRKCYALIEAHREKKSSHEARQNSLLFTLKARGTRQSFNRKECGCQIQIESDFLEGCEERTGMEQLCLEAGRAGRRSEPQLMLGQVVPCAQEPA